MAKKEPNEIYLAQLDLLLTIKPLNTKLSLVSFSLPVAIIKSNRL
jgi:hypothetical protein